MCVCERERERVIADPPLISIHIVLCLCLYYPVDNRSLKPRKRNQVDIGGFMGEAPVDRPHISSQQRLAIYQFLSSSKSISNHELHHIFCTEMYGFRCKMMCVRIDCCF